MTRRTITFLAAAAALTAALALSPTTAGGQSAPCDQPYSPVAAEGSNVVNGDFGEVPEVDASEVSTSLQVSDAFDSDGDGVDDTVAQEPGGGIRIGRGDGDLVLTTEGPAQAFRVGDIDGDGRDEFAVTHGGFLSGVYLIPGTTAPGTTTPNDAGIQTPIGTVGITYLEDGSGRLLDHVEPTNSVSEASTGVFDAATVLALGPGGDANTLTPDLSVPGTTQVVADLGGELVLLVGRTLTGPDRVEISVVDGTDIVELTTVPERFEDNYVSPYGALSVLVGPDGTFVRLQQSSRAGGATYLWSLDDPCTSLVDPTGPPATVVPPTAPPARPVPAAAAFTG